MNAPEHAQFWEKMVRSLPAPTCARCAAEPERSVHASSVPREQKRFAAGISGAAFLLLIGLYSQAGTAGPFGVNPVRIDLSDAARISAITVRNTAAETIVLQSRALTWSQADGKDAYNATRELLVSPPIVMLPPGVEQTIRVGLRRAPDAHRELSYRLLLQEVPPPPQLRVPGSPRALLWMEIPVFVHPQEGRAGAALVWDLKLQSDDTIRLQVKNEGARHIQVSDIELFLPGREDAIAAHFSLTSVLAGGSSMWELKLQPPRPIKATDRLRLKVLTSAGSINTEIGLATPHEVGTAPGDR